MQGVFGITAEEASNAAGKSAVKTRGPSELEATDGKSAVGDENWFSEAAQHLYAGNKPGMALWLTTGLGDERACQRYAAGHVKPAAYFLRALLRSPQGWTWLCAAMDGSDAEWWRDVRYAYEIIAVFEAKRKELLSGNGNAGGGAAVAARGAQGAPGKDGRA